MLIDEILANWSGMPSGSAMKITSLDKLGYVSWTVKTNEGYGVAMPISSEEEISEYFAGAHYFSGVLLLNEENKERVLMLITSKDDIKEQFASLCAELLNPGIEGELREEIMESPESWWLSWKELLGNRNVDMRVYDVLGELWTLKYLAERNEHAEWNGPLGSTYDIDCEGYFVEVKSSTARNKRQVTLSNLFQLDPPNGMKLYLYFCQFEAALSGYSINELVDALEKLGYSRSALNEKLERLGLENGKTARSRKYVLHSAIKYVIDENFPAIRNDSFVGGSLPSGVMSFTYTITLDGISGDNLLSNGE